MIVMFLGIVGGLIVFTYSTAKKSRLPAQPVIACAACGANVPAGSAFCNFCGKEMGK